jgi:hypothetical protein
VAEIYITSKKLIETLKIDDVQLIAIEKFFDAHDDDQWEVLEGKDYKVVAGSGLREYTCSGAFAIAEYLEFTKQSSGGWFKKMVRRLILAIKGDVRKAFVQQQILSNSSSLVSNNGSYLLSRGDAIAIFSTNAAYLKKMREAARVAGDPTTLIQGKDYVELPDKGDYIALSGMEKLARTFAANIVRCNRKDWCVDVEKVVTPCINDILKQIEKRDKAIANAIKQAKSREKKTCQVTSVHSNKINKIQMAGHHLYSRAEYPHLVDSVDNIICITCEVHDHFHEFMGGHHKPCTLDDFERFVKEYHPASSVFIWLQNQRLRLGNQQPITRKERHVLHLPWPIPKLLSPGK